MAKALKMIIGGAGIALLVSSIFAVQCDSERNAKPEGPRQVSFGDQIPVSFWQTDPTHLSSESLGNVDVKAIELSAPETRNDCESVLREGGEVLEAFPSEGSGVNEPVFGRCKPEARHLSRERSELGIGFAVERAQKEVPALQIAVYERSHRRDNGSTDRYELRWSRRLDRPESFAPFDSKYRSAFLVRLQNDLWCGGTLWVDKTTATCMRADSGQPVWSGTWDFRATTRPIGLDSSLFMGKRTGISRRYPYSGVEMRFKSFGERGGTGDVYAIGRTSFVYGSKSSQAPGLYVYRLPSMEARWHVSWPEARLDSIRAVDLTGQILVLQVEQRLYGIDLDQRQIEWGVTFSESPEQIAVTDAGMFVYTPGAPERSRLLGLERTTGKVKWRAKAPSEVRQMRYVSGHLVFDHVRTSQVAILNE